MMVRPIFGGLFVSYGTWRGVFFVNVPIGVAIFVLLVAARPMVAHIPEYHGAWQPDHCSALPVHGRCAMRGSFRQTKMREECIFCHDPG